MISEGTRVRGRLLGHGTLVIEGQVEGDIDLKGHLHIGEKGVAAASIEAEEVTVEGQVEGDIVATEQVQLVGSARVQANIRSNRIALEQGVRFQGRIDCEFQLPPQFEKE
ncbi:hypothetical protein BCY86_08415 [Pajaroellobacter abortibovis]|uniref:Cell shape determination protein CcmA n=2 Tax=Pajaroellobacter abortibovis TaxID=1882918 RepID=A0A1L6MZM5_9BACT|nr:hypothetical protein BCY86_08415 [Pajaroellobacter abortibovis]